MGLCGFCRCALDGVGYRLHMLAGGTFGSSELLSTAAGRNHRSVLID